MQKNLKNKLNYARFGQISFVFTIGMAMYLFTTIPHNWWILLTVIMMSAAIEPGLIIKKSINRGKGTLIGILLFLPLIYLLQLNYRFIPLVFILLSIGISVPNAKRYDISVIFMTMMVFTMNAYNFTVPTQEGPFEATLNRGICTVIGIIICIAGDYFLFRRFDYSRKVYFLLQHELCNMLEKKIEMIRNAHKQKLNRYLIVENLRESFNQAYTTIATSAESIRLSLNTNAETKQKINDFDITIWQLRKAVFGLYYSECILQHNQSSEEHLERFKHLIDKARRNFISLRN
ncbi:MAG: FUSC family protein [Neisseriales bacterium]|nr:MAG: FUSC family protein [Neisseriales bacterium]